MGHLPTGRFPFLRLKRKIHLKQPVNREQTVANGPPEATEAFTNPLPGFSPCRTVACRVKIYRFAVVGCLFTAAFRRDRREAAPFNQNTQYLFSSRPAFTNRGDSASHLDAQ